MKRIFVTVTAVLCALAVAPTSLSHHADSRWDGTGDRPVKVVDSLTSRWSSALSAADDGWSRASVVNLDVVRGSTKRKARKKCSAPSGAIRICNYDYGRKGWAGIAVTWIDSAGRIVKAKAKLNEHYIRNSHQMRVVACHELGHTLGLLHRAQTDNTSCLTPVISSGEIPDDQDIAHLESTYGGGGGGPHQHAATSEEMTVRQDGAYRRITVKILAHD